MIDGIILAGGKSTRMNTNKMLLEIDGRPLLWHTIHGMKPFVNRIFVVTGKYDQDIRAALKDEDVTFVYNPDFELGMFSSVLAGVKQVSNDFLLIPGDCPFVKADTYKKILSGSKDIRVVRYLDKDGHPIYISKKYIDELLKCPLDYNLKLFRDSKKYEIINVKDENILLNINNVFDVHKVNINERKW